MVQQSSSTKKAQVFTLDFLLALLIFTATVIVSLKLVFNTETNDDYQLLQLEARAISDALMSEGIPNNWDSNNVSIPGILSNKKLSETKLQELKNLGYHNVSNLINARRNFYFYFANSTDILNITFCGFGEINETCTQPEIEARNIVKLDRIVVHEQKAVKMVVLVWD